jgi:hypothetical protein
MRLRNPERRISSGGDVMLDAPEALVAELHLVAGGAGAAEITARPAIRLDPPRPARNSKRARPTRFSAMLGECAMWTDMAGDPRGANEC